MTAGFVPESFLVAHFLYPVIGFLEDNVESDLISVIYGTASQNSTYFKALLHSSGYSTHYTTTSS